MWKKEDAKSQGVPEISTGSQISTSDSLVSATSPRVPMTATPVISSAAAACISQGITIKGEVTGSEDLFVDGIVEGQLNLANGSVTIGPNGHVKADISAREVIVRGHVEGKISARERVQLWNTAQVAGEVHAERLAIEDGAQLRGRVETGKRNERQPDKQMASTAAAAN